MPKAASWKDELDGFNEEKTMENHLYPPDGRARGITDRLECETKESYRCPLGDHVP